MNNITAKIIADSISESEIRITTLELEFPRFLLAQFNTHRMFSRSAQSSRAVPFDKLRESVRKSLVPEFSKNQSGMQAGEKLTGFELTRCKEYWEQTKRECLYFASGLADAGVHKQWVNRLLEPFSTVKVVVTATEWENFFALRLHHAAQPEMQELAQAMKTAMDESNPSWLSNAEWHLPYITEREEGGSEIDSFEKMRLISAARCARVSYLNHDNTNPDIEKDLELAQKLLVDKHLSPFEHQAKPINDYEVFKEISLAVTDKNLDKFGITHIDKKDMFWSGNFKGWTQYRHLIGENNGAN